MKQKLFNPDIAPSCQYCLHGRASESDLGILCVKCGIVEDDFSCGKYKYDPLKRVPNVLPKLPKFENDEFDLDAAPEEEKKQVAS